MPLGYDFDYGQPRQGQGSPSAMPNAFSKPANPNSFFGGDDADPEGMDLFGWRKNAGRNWLRRGNMQGSPKPLPQFGLASANSSLYMNPNSANQAPNPFIFY